MNWRAEGLFKRSSAPTRLFDEIALVISDRISYYMPVEHPFVPVVAGCHMIREGDQHGPWPLVLLQEVHRWRLRQPQQQEQPEQAAERRPQGEPAGAWLQQVRRLQHPRRQPQGRRPEQHRSSSLSVRRPDHVSPDRYYLPGETASHNVMLAKPGG